jgi:hypothetical protein
VNDTRRNPTKEKAMKTTTITFTKSIPFPGKRFQVGDTLTGVVVKAWVRGDGVECFAFATTDGVLYAGISYRSVTLS